MKLLEMLGLVMMGLLFFIWPVPHTVSARDFLLLLNLVLFGYLALRQGWSRAMVRDLSIPVVILVALTAWMYIVAVFVSTETAWSLGEIQSQWWRALAALLIGAFAAYAGKDISGFREKIWLVPFAVLMLHLFYVDFLAMKEWFASGPAERVEGLTGGPDMSSYLTNILFGFLLAELFSGAVHQKRPLPVYRAVLATAWMLAIISVFAERTRNQMITLVLMMLVLGGVYLSTQRGRLKKPVFLAGVGVMLLVVLGGMGLVVTARESSGLSNLIGTVPIAWDTEHNTAWRNEGQNGWPKLPNGEIVDISAYLRIAWFKEGISLVRDHPLGIGYGRDAFGHGMKLKFGEGSGYSHSGLLDMMIGIGIPGAALWIAFIVSLMYLSYARMRVSSNYAAVLLFLLVLDYGARTLLDSVVRDHMLQQFMFLVGLAAVMMVTEAKTTDSGKPVLADG